MVFIHIRNRGLSHSFSQKSTKFSVGFDLTSLFIKKKEEKKKKEEEEEEEKEEIKKKVRKRKWRLIGNFVENLHTKSYINAEIQK